MARYRYWSIARDSDGDVIDNALIQVYTAGPVVATIYGTEAGGAVDYVTSNTTGYFEFWVDTDDGYDYSTRFTLLITAAGGLVGSYPNISFIPNTKDFANPITMTDLPIFGNNADAIWGGLTVGRLYRTGGDPDYVCVVH